MKALVVGTGSIGQRHIQNLTTLGVEVCAFSYRNSAGLESSFRSGARLVPDLTSALAENFDLVVVANKTDQHLSVALEAAKSGKNLFIEKPLSASLDSVGLLLDLVSSKALVVEAGYTLRSHPNLIWLKDFLSSGQLGEIYYVRAMVGQWLPSWRPDSDHRICYSAFRDTGGGVIFDLVHELDLVTWLCGNADEVTAMTHVVPVLEIETEGIAQIGLRLASGVLAQVHLDYVRPSYGRSLEIVGKDGTIEWDYVRGQVILRRPNGADSIAHSVESNFERNSMFLSHMAHMLKRIQNKCISARSPIADSVDVLKIALAAHRSSSERRHVKMMEFDVYECSK